MRHNVFIVNVATICMGDFGHLVQLVFEHVVVHLGLDPKSRLG
jgi:hypothetical protein